ncbi:MAG: lipid-A-disaccharide synthase [Vicinamibacterales bacterium]
MRVMVSCGEPSGDLYAGALAAEILRKRPSTEIVGFGGDRLQAAGARLLQNFSGLSVTGLLEAVRVLPQTYGTYRRLVEDAEATRPDVFVAVDFPDFNFVLARALKKRGIPIVCYISPQLWAWRSGRMATMKRLVERVLVIFPFEEQIYRDAGVPVEWVGHPLFDLAREPAPRESFLRSIGIAPERPVVALLPGSRTNELRAILPDLITASALIRLQVPDVQFLLARAPHLRDELLAPLLDLPPAHRIVVVDGRADDVLAAVDAAVVASGTITVQAALHGCPMVVVYRLSPMTYRLGKPFVRVETYAMPNLVAGRSVVRELIQDDFTPAAVASETVRLLTDFHYADGMRGELREVAARLGGTGASSRAADAVLAVAERRGHVG